MQDDKILRDIKAAFENLKLAKTQNTERSSIKKNINDSPLKVITNKHV